MESIQFEIEKKLWISYYTSNSYPVIDCSQGAHQPPRPLSQRCPPQMDLKRRKNVVRLKWSSVESSQHGTEFRQFTGTQTLPTCQRHHISSSAFVNHNVFDGHVTTFYMNQERHIVIQASMKSYSFKLDDRGIIIIINTKSIKKIFPLWRTTLKYFEYRHHTRSVAQILDNYIVLGGSGIRIVH